MQAGHEVLSLERRGAVGWLTLNRPGSINAINNALRRAIPQAVRELETDSSVRAIVLQGAGDRGFSAGADLKEESSEATATLRCEWFEAFEDVAKPLIASIHGYCLGGGLEIALACDIRIASGDALFALPETGLGLIPGGGGTQRLSRLIGAGRALDLVITGDRIDARQALRIGLVSRLVESRDELRETTAQLAQRIAEHSPLAVRMAKRAVREGLEIGLKAGLELERELFRVLLGSSDRSEAAAAFREKRSPVFTGQ